MTPIDEIRDACKRFSVGDCFLAAFGVVVIPIMIFVLGAFPEKNIARNHIKGMRIGMNAKEIQAPQANFCFLSCKTSQDRRKWVYFTPAEWSNFSKSDNPIPAECRALNFQVRQYGFRSANYEVKFDETWRISEVSPVFMVNH